MEIRYYVSETWWGFNNAGSRVDENDDMMMIGLKGRARRETQTKPTAIRSTSIQ
jgi:hypothetical protein